MLLTAQDGNSVYLTYKKADVAKPLYFTFHRVYLRISEIPTLLQKEWPNATFVYQAYYAGDDFFLGLPYQEATQIFTDSGLARYKWTPNVFDCDDFSYVYKGQASKAAYSEGLEYSYAVGVIFGTSTAGGHAVNLFIDVVGNVKVIEPQNGQIQDGKDWPYSPYFLLM